MEGLNAQGILLKYKCVLWRSVEVNILIFVDDDDDDDDDDDFIFVVCGNLSATEHVNISCEFDSNNTNCTISCEEGYEFDHTAKPFYLCGEATYHFWDFKTSDNPEGKLPQCIGRYFCIPIYIPSLFIFAYYVHDFSVYIYDL